MKYNFLALIFLFIIASCNNNQPNNSSTTATNAKDDKIVIVDNKNIQSNNVSQRNELATNDKKLVTKTKLHPITVPSKIENEAEESEGKLSKAQRIKESLEDEIRRTKDPATGLVPMGKFGDALEFTRRKQAEFYGKGELRGSTLANAKWKERGPTNVGGRVGTILVDKNDPTNKTLFVGHCSGGLWKTTDITATRPLWKPVNDYLQNLAVGGLVQDPTNPKIMYMGTGDPSADDVKGIGIFKSTDGGENWTLLPSTINKTAFSKTREIVIANDGAIYAACKQGVQKSTDGGNTWTSVLSNEIWDLEYIPSTNTLFASKNNSIWKSNTGNSGSWKNITSTDGFANLWQRMEFTVCQNSPNVIYAVGGLGGPNSAAYKSIDTGATWTITGLNSGTLTGSQAWYDLDIKVDPTNPNRVFAGGLDLYFSVNGGNSWKQVSEWSPKSSPTYVHADQHYIHFEPDNGDVCYFGNDGGIFATRNASKTIQPTIDDKNTGFNTTLFYYGGIHPSKFSNYFLGGAQDNGSNQMDSYYPAEANEFRGGDGFWVHIDQNEPNIQFGSLYGGIFFISEDGGKSFGGGVNSDGAFRTFAAYADKDNILYAQSNTADFYRYNLKTKEETPINLKSGSVGEPSCMTIDPNDSTRLYIGNFSGQITKVEKANIGSDLSGKLLTSPNSIAGGGGAVSSIDIEYGNPNHILVCYSNYGLKNHILESKDGGITWIGVQGTNALPDIPVRWAIFDPSNASRAMIATEMGVWTTDNLDGANTVWFPPIPGKGTPLVRTDHLEYRSSDKVVMAATWGRGIWSSDVFADPFVSIVHPTIGYINGGILFESNSLGAESFSWNFGDQTNIETVDKVIHYYQSKGLYNVSLTINNNFTASSSVKILPDKELPYIYGASDYGGDFTGNDDQYGVYTVSGSGWERGTSTFAGKNKTDKSFVIAPGKQYYDINSESYLYMPNFNMGSKGIYEFSFNTKYKFQEGADGFNIEYSTDKGLTWKQLGSSSDIGWYNHNNGITATSFKSGSSYFTGELLKLTKFTLNISKLSGPGFENVAFRFAFKSDGVGLHVGGLVDDVEITKYDGELVTKLIDNTAKFSDFQAIAIKVDWSTLPEFGCKKFEIELSTNGKDFSTAGSVFAFGTTATRQNYTFTITPTNKALYFIRIKVINNDGSFSYSSVMVVKKNLNDEVIFNYYPNPFTSNIQFTFTDLISKNVKFEMFDITGRLVYSKEEKLDNQAFYILDLPELTSGKYALRVTIDNNEPILLNVIKQNK